MIRYRYTGTQTSRYRQELPMADVVLDFWYRILNDRTVTRIDPARKINFLSRIVLETK